MLGQLICSSFCGKQRVHKTLSIVIDKYGAAFTVRMEDKEFETIKEYSNILLGIANKMKLLESDFVDSRIVEKILEKILFYGFPKIQSFKFHFDSP
ncbi:hypothetical protein CR513_45303, partial [Mucuna pruriens]